MKLRRLLRTSFFVGSLLTAAGGFLGATASEARAASHAKPKLAIGGFAGDKNGEVRDAFLAALREDGGYEITDAEDVKASESARAVADAAKAMEVNVVITGKISGQTLKLKLLDAEGRVLKTPELKGGTRAKLKANIQKSAAFSIADGVEQAVQADRARAEQAEQAEQQKGPARAGDEASTDDESGPGLPALELMAGLRALHRTFTFHQTIAELRPNDGFGQFLRYKLPLGPVIYADLNWYPGAHFAHGQAERIGLSAGYEKGFAISTVYDGDAGGKKQTLTTDEHGFYLGARYRLPLSVHELAGTLSYGQHTFALGGDSAAPLVPDVKYSYVKLAADGTLRFGKLSVGVRVGKRFVLGTGSLESVWFPGSVKTQSLEAGASVGYRLLPELDAVVGIDWLRYAFDFNPVRRRAGFESAVAGGAVDEYWSGFAGVRLHLPGARDAAAAPAGTAAPAAGDD